MHSTIYHTLILTTLYSLSDAIAPPTRLQVPGNPILQDGRYYTADPAPFVHNNTFYILTGRDEAPATVNDFIMNEWSLLSTSSPASNTWSHHANIGKPQDIFQWATRGRAYAAQIVPKDGKFYLYAPVAQTTPRAKDPFGIGVAVASVPQGPYRDLHPQGPILSQTTPPPGNNIQNIDPTVYIDSDKRVYIYFGTFGQLRAYELRADMITPIASTLKTIRLPGFFEAPWLTKRKNTYYLIYAANNAGPTSPCTPTSYHACQAYATAPSPLGPWTYQGILLDLVSSTTSHSGAVEFNNQWYLTYHTADAQGSTHFRRAVAIDKLDFDDGASPPRIRKVKQTHRSKGPRVPTRNIAPNAVAKSQNQTPIQYWIKALNDQRIPKTPLPPDYWSSYAGDRSPKTSTLTYTWPTTVQINGARIVFFADQRAGSAVGVPPPQSWWLEYQAGNEWRRIQATYPTRVGDNAEEVKFATVSTRSLRAVLNASGGGGKFAGVGIKEWEVLAPVAA